MKPITGLEELDRELRHVDERFSVSDDEDRGVLAGFTSAAYSNPVALPSGGAGKRRAARR
jgi:hypothetical protein